MSLKTNKSFAKRLKVTRNGKIMARTPGLVHFNAKQKRSKQLEAKVPVQFKLKAKDKARFLPYA